MSDREKIIEYAESVSDAFEQKGLVRAVLIQGVLFGARLGFEAARGQYFAGKIYSPVYPTLEDFLKELSNDT